MDKNNLKRKSGPVLITGSSSGIGKFLCEFLAKKGVKVYATARKLNDLAWINSLEKNSRENVIKLQLDVTDTTSIGKAVESVERDALGLYGLVNNAGVGDLGFHTTFSEEELFNIFNVNTFGPWRITNAFFKLLIESKGRIVNIGSQGGMITKKFYGPYSMTKFALEAYTESLHAEINPFGMYTSIIQPGGIITEIGNKSFNGLIQRLKRAEKPFKVEANQILQAIENPEPQSTNTDNQPESENNRKPSSPEIVAIAVEHALFSEKPKLRYMVGTKWEGDRVLNALMKKVVEENDCSTHQYTRNQLIKLLDFHIEKYEKK